MNTMIITGILATVRAALTWHAARQNGDRQAALAALSATDLGAFGLDDDTRELLELSRAGLAYLSKRGLAVEQAVALIERADAEGRDVTSDEVRAQLAVTHAELDETQALIDQMGDA